MLIQQKMMYNTYFSNKYLESIPKYTSLPVPVFPAFKLRGWFYNNTFSLQDIQKEYILKGNF
jgi:hypothetical protein